MGKKMRKGNGPNQQQTQLYDKITKIEANILKKIQRLKLLPKFSYCQHLSLQKNEAEPYDPTTNYYDRYWKRFLVNEVARGEITKLQDQITYLTSRLSKLQSLFEQRKLQLTPFQKYRPRRHRQEQVTTFTCATCKRNYNDRETLMLHQQIKHGHGREDHNKKEEEEGIYQEDQDQQELLV